MKTLKIFIKLTILSLLSAPVVAGNFVSDFMEGEASGSFRLRGESVDIDKTPTAGTEDDGAQAVTLRSRLVYKTNGYEGFKAVAEFEDVHALEVDDYNLPPDPVKNYAVIADPEMTELNEAKLIYANDSLTLTGGRQRIVYDNMRFVGHVGWRQDDQTFDAYKVDYGKDAFMISAAYIDQVNGILGDAHKIDKSDMLVNASYDFESFGKLTGYSYMLENDGTEATQDTTGLRFSGKYDDSFVLNYTLEFASQTAEAGPGAAEMEADYIFAELGTEISGLALALGSETLGSDDGTYGFSTDLATKHAFNGWADVFLTTPTAGLVDNYVKVGGTVSGIKLLGIYHTFTTDEDVPADDLGDELDILATKKINDYLIGLKYSAYGAGDAGADINKLWLWTQVSF